MLEIADQGLDAELELLAELVLLVAGHVPEDRACARDEPLEDLVLDGARQPPR